MLHLGLRQGEVGARRVRDLDESGAALWITGGKTRNAKRRLVVPAFLRPLLLQQIEKKQPDDLIFVEDDKPPTHSYFWLRVKMICDEAGVPRVCPHSLRGLHATLALEAGATSESVARSLGHGSFEITARHYATPDSVLANRQQRVAKVLGSDTPERIAGLLSSLTPEELAELKRQLGSG
jgi:integrase